ncbi:hypothetical protein [Microbacterium amylolyticum]|uniref:N-acetylglutamate synthase n=1 Tax=Microbacterium amylolyticum TaxID=936337 RepID=A0ABS4ZHJ2_9MICO|nr:hypothetical protein [Microbacterium amylolyticum]MBP2436749.1 hypothetical protein [Microbacterium amylolyticum]
MTGRDASPSLDGRIFVAESQAAEGGVGPETVFTYHEADGDIWATYAGGEVRRGYLVGTRQGDTLSFRYSQMNQARETASGRCTAKITATTDRRLRLEETWAWESKPGNGSSAVVELI